MLKLDILIPWKGRDELSRCLKENDGFFRSKGVEALFTIINCGGDKKQVRDLSSLASIDTPIRILHFEYDGFNKALALNIGVISSSAPYVMVLDTDVIMKEIDIIHLRNLLEKGAFVTVDKVFEEKPIPTAFPEAKALAEIAYYIEFKGADGTGTLVEMNRKGLLDQSRGAPGIIITSRTSLIEIGGYNSELEGWGWEDLDLITRIQWSLGMERNKIGEAMHITHDDRVRHITPEFRSKKDNEQRNFQTCLINYRLGIIEGSLEEDNKYTHLLEEDFL